MVIEAGMKADTEQIWKEYHNKLSLFIKSRVHPDEAEDLLQEVFVKIHTHMGSLKDDTRLESWIYQITRNAIIDFYRLRKPQQALPGWLQAHDDDGMAPDIRRELAGCLLPMINRLPEKYRLAVQLSEIDGKTQQEVAERENISLSGAKSRVQRGRALLGAMLADCCSIEINARNQPVDYDVKDKSGKYC